MAEINFPSNPTNGQEHTDINGQLWSYDGQGWRATADYTEPETTGIPPGGTTGQTLAKTSNTDYDADWEDAAGGVTDHTALTNIGTNTHAQLDAHLADMDNPHGTQGGAIAEIGATAPINPVHGQLWWNNEDGNLYIYYTDADSSQWVVAMSYAVPIV